MRKSIARDIVLWFIIMILISPLIVLVWGASKDAMALLGVIEVPMLIDKTDWMRALQNTLHIAIPVSILATLTAFITAYWVTRSPTVKKLHATWDLLALTIYMLPTIAVIPFANFVFGSGTVVVSSLDSAFGRKCFVILLNIVFCWPFAFIMCKRFFSQVSLELEEYCFIEKVAFLKILRYAIVPRPAVSKGVVTVAIFVFIISANDYVFAFWFLGSDDEWKPITLIIQEQAYGNETRNLHRVYLVALGLQIILASFAFIMGQSFGKEETGYHSR